MKGDPSERPQLVCCRHLASGVIARGYMLEREFLQADEEFEEEEEENETHEENQAHLTEAFEDHEADNEDWYYDEDRGRTLYQDAQDPYEDVEEEREEFDNNTEQEDSPLRRD